jgi:type IV secretory pathway ATPase VirB11/archaellum biosynthesis ATPase
MRPSRIVVGEVRQEECLDLTQYKPTYTGYEPSNPSMTQRSTSTGTACR